MPEPKRLLLCVPESADHTPDSILMDADCGHAVWVAAGGQRMLADHADAMVKCIPCGMPEALQSPEPIRATPGMLDEIEAEGGPAERARAEKIMEALGLKEYKP